MNPEDPNLIEFYRGIRTAEELVIKLKPDIVVVPLRGAKPLNDYIRRLADADGRLDQTPAYVEIPLGEVSTDDGKTRMGVLADTQDVKKAVLKEYLLPKIKDLGERPLILVLDEVGSGGAIVKNIYLTQEVLQEAKPHGRVVAVGVGGAGRRRKIFTTLRAGGVLEEITLQDKFGKNSMITMDRPDILVALERGEDGQVRAVGGESGASKELGDLILQVHAKHRYNPNLRHSKILKSVGRWRRECEDSQNPARLQQVTPMVWTSGMPHRPAHVETLAGLGINSIISFEKISNSMKNKLADAGIDVQEIPIADEEKPSAFQLKQFFDYMHLRKTRKTLLQCRHGFGRSVTMAAALMLEVGEPFDKVAELGIERLSQSQRDFIMDFAKQRMRERMDANARELEAGMRETLRKRLQTRPHAKL
ncbi:MAG TPA: hypothetical protein ENN13_04370 [Candidatus Altiarchaeales archaeon]|nr:hypothetical protein [Candidatus Altiarchaeales archaeon]